MANVQPSRVRETSATTGTGTYTLAGAVTGYQTFASQLSNSDTVDYVAVLGANWEIGRGTYSAGTLAWTAIYASSNAGSAVDWASGAKDVFAASVGISDLDATGLTNLVALLAVLPLSGGVLTGPLTVDGQIVYPATQNASSDPNTHDDYEEGTWTPVARGGGTAGSPTGTFAGWYQKDGRVVHGGAQISFTDLDTMAGDLEITGFPFTINSAASDRFGIVPGHRDNFTNDFPMSCLPVVGDTYITIERADVDDTDVQITDLSATSQFYFSFTYRTTG